jgi:ferritin-like metal-binding protein YciE
MKNINSTEKLKFKLMATKQSKSTTNQRMPDDSSALMEFFVDSLKDMYWAEKNAVKAMPKMAKKATSQELRSALETHLAETENQVVKLEQVFASLDQKAQAKKCEAMEGLIKESESIMSETEDGTMTRDVGIIAAAQKMEHYEIASYGTMRTLADVLGLPEASELLSQILEEEKNTDVMLTQIAEGFVNQSAMGEE